MEVRNPVLHLELTSKCALRCPECARTKYLDRIKATELPLSVIKSIRDSGQEFREISLCGDHGDPIYHSEFHEAIRLLKTFPGSPLVAVATNGSYRTADWWRETAKLLVRRDEVIFGVDGLQDTLPLYRVNADWSSIILAMETLKRHSRVRVIWQWILFKHNEHQLPEAGKLARELKIDEFLVIKSSRYSPEDKNFPSLSVEAGQEEFRRGYDLSTL